MTCLRQVLLEETPTTSSMRPSLHFSGRPDTATTPVLSSFSACHLLHISFSPPSFKILTLECETELAFLLLVPTPCGTGSGTVRGRCRAAGPGLLQAGGAGLPWGSGRPGWERVAGERPGVRQWPRPVGVFLLKPVAPPRPLLQGT